MGFPSGNYACEDGYFSIVGPARLGFWPRVVDMLEMPELLEDPRFCTAEAQGRLENAEAFTEIFLPWCMERTVEEIVELGQAKRVLVGPVNNARDLVNNPHMKARDYFVVIEHPTTGKIKYPGAPFKAGNSFQIKRPAPLLGQHNEEVYRQLGYTRKDLVKLKETGVI
jgi:crotonobetainyl-CoA:carnitine CoA-transferase CaiB-like acyl-CoA transferase